MTRITRVLPILCALFLPCGSASAADTWKPANPRTMTFPALKFEIPKCERVQLKNGIVVYLLADHELPLVNVTAYISAGGIYDPAGKVGLAELTGAALRSGGTEGTPPDKLDSELEYMASSIESAIGADVANVAISTLSKNLDRTLELFTEVLTKPGFDPYRLDLAKNNTIEAIRRQNDDPKEVADRELKRAIYPGHPLGRVPTVADLRAISRNDVIAFHNRYFSPSHMILAVSGDFDRGKLLPRLEKLLGSWQKAAPEFPPISDPKDDPAAEVLHVQKAVNQSVIRMGHLGLDKNNPDLYAVKVLDFILGGGFTSRLMQEIRSNQGLAYNVEADFQIGRRFRAPFVAETETKTESTGRTITLLRSIIAGMTVQEVTDQELKLAKDSIINSFIFGFTKADVVVNQRARLEYYGYPAGYLENYRDRIAKVTKEDVLKAARKYLHPDAMKLVVVGDEKKFDQPLNLFGGVREIKLDSVN